MEIMEIPFDNIISNDVTHQRTLQDLREMVQILDSDGLFLVSVLYSQCKHRKIFRTRGSTLERSHVSLTAVRISATESVE